MSDDLDRIFQKLDALSGLPPMVEDIQATVKGMEKELVSVHVKNAEQSQQIAQNREQVIQIRGHLGTAFAKIEGHVADHWKFYLATVGLVGAIMGVAKVI